MASNEPQVQFASAQGRWVLAATVLGLGMAQLDATVVNVALPSIGRVFHAGVDALQLVVTAYLVSLAALVLLSGALGDRLGRRRVFVVGVVWFAVASLLCALAPTVEVLIGARLLQGIGGALLTPGSLALIESVFAPEDRGRAIGAWAAFGGVAAAVGPLVGGYLVQSASWRAIFVVNLPLGAAVAWVAVQHVPESRDRDVVGGLDYLGATLATAGLAGATYTMVMGTHGGLGSPLVLAAAMMGVLGLVGFPVWERRVAHPMLPLEIFSSRQFTSANLVTFGVYAARGGVFFLLVVVLQTSLGYSPVAAGTASLPVTVIMLALSSSSGALASRIGPRIPLTVGPLLIAGGMLLMTRIAPGQRYVDTVLPAVIVFALGLVATVAPVTATALAAAGPRHAGAASGVNNAVARVAGLLAVALLSPIAGLTGDAFQNPAAMAAGFHTAMLVTAGLPVAGAALAWTTISDDVLRTEPAAPPGHHTHCVVAGPPHDPAHSEPAPRVTPRHRRARSRATRPPLVRGRDSAEVNRFCPMTERDAWVARGGFPAAGIGSSVRRRPPRSSTPPGDAQ